MNMFGFPLVNPVLGWVALGLATLPVIIYLLNRRRYREVPWAAMIFLLAANRKSIRRTRLEQILLLIVRAGVIGLLAFALARPYWPARSSPRWLSAGTHHLVILDNSFSMGVNIPSGAESGPAHRLFDLQKSRAEKLIDELPSGDPITIITMSSPAGIVNLQPLFDKKQAAEVVRSTLLSDRATDLPGALRIVTETMERFPEYKTRTVYVFSDFAGPALKETGSTAAPTTTSLIRSLAQKAQIVVYHMLNPSSANLSLTGLTLSNPIVGIGSPTEIVCSIHNYSTSRSGALKLKMRLDDQWITEKNAAPLEAGETRREPLPVEFAQAGLHSIEVVLEATGSDAVSLDDVRRRVVNVREEVPILIVDGKPGSSRMHGQAGYLSAALSPHAVNVKRTLLTPKVVSENAFATMDLRPFEVIYLCNVRLLAPEQWQQLQNRVEQGTGLVIYLGDLIDLENYNSAGAALLGAPLDRPAFETVSDEQSVRIDPNSLSEELADDFAGRRESGLFTARVHQYFKLSSASGLNLGRILQVFDNGDPMVIVRDVGRGRSMLVTTSANMDWTNLPARGDFVTLTLNLLQVVAPPNQPTRNLIVGQTFLEKTTSPHAGGSAAGSIVQPDGTNLRPDIRFENDEYFWQCDAMDRAGWYELQAAGQNSPIAVNVDPAESDLTPTDEKTLRDKWGTDFQYIEVNPAGEKIVTVSIHEFAIALLYVALILMLVETLLATLFGYQKTET